MESDFGVVKIGMNAEYPPFEFVDENGAIAGFDPELVALLAERESDSGLITLRLFGRYEAQRFRVTELILW